jgi:large subunit ribosomal protein L25
MEHPTVLTVQLREGVGKGPARRLRQTGWVPAVLCSANKPAVPLSVEPRELGRALSGPKGHNQILTLNVVGATGNGSHTVLVKEVQYHPVKHKTVHADFAEVDITKPVKLLIPLVLVGKNKNIAAGGVIEQVSRKVPVKARADAIPEKIEVDISELKMGRSIHLKDIALPAGLSLIGNGIETVATVVAIREEKAVEVAVPTAAVPGAPAAAGAAAPAAGATPGKPGETKAGEAKPAAAGGRKEEKK